MGWWELPPGVTHCISDSALAKGSYFNPNFKKERSKKRKMREVARYSGSHQ
jgi:hypothetical protein